MTRGVVVGLILTALFATLAMCDPHPPTLHISISRQP
jgi:hypothetical protein